VALRDTTAGDPKLAERVAATPLNEPTLHATNSPRPHVTLPIEDYALIGNTITAALVSRNGSIDWLSLPRFDSPACFAALLGHSGNGRWIIAPRGALRSTERRYRPDTLILETRFRTDEGEVLLIDFMPLPQPGGGIEVMRIVKGVRGSIAMSLQAIFRFDYGTIVPWVTRRDYGINAIGGPDALQLRTPLPLEGRDQTTVAEFTVHEGDTIPFALTWYPSHHAEPGARDPLGALEETERFWREWAAQAEIAADWEEPVMRSLLTLKALTYRPTGGIVAAATTSLPEFIGGVRNWDYRYCWVRDATFALYALLTTGYRKEAQDWRDWLLRAVAGQPSELQIMYGLAGERRLWEHELPWLDGYAQSRPVRIGNAAHAQRQLDIYGEVMDAFHVGREHRIEGDDTTWEVQCKLLEFLESGWRQPDSGIWEVRGPERRYTHSAIMAWVAADRAVKAVERFGLAGPADKWRALRSEIHAEVCRYGYDAEKNCFVQYFGSKRPDAALLLIPQVGFLPASDPRVAGTVDAIQRELMSDGFVHRYHTSPEIDGLPPGEGIFIACSFWLADNLVLLGRKEEARALFERLLAIRNDVGLLAEQYDPHAKRLLGNFPQAFSHVGLINTAHNLSQSHGPAKRRGNP
jgi:GH15 family glucan-1,4-alpha-glucosidase